MTAPKRAAYIVGGLPVPFNVAWVEPDLLVIHARGRASDGDDDDGDGDDDERAVPARVWYGR